MTDDAMPKGRRSETRGQGTGDGGQKTGGGGQAEDIELLRCYAEEGSEEAFGELVRRHIDFVYAAALRQGRGNTPLAQDVTQAVFTDLARKAARLARHEVVVGWLHTATRFATAKAIRAENRWQRREREANAMNEIVRDAGAPLDWERLHPVLDAVLGELKERERAAILLRFFEKRPLAEVGAKLSLTETAARSCVDRALDKMRTRLAGHGITSTAAALGMALTNQVALAAPVGLATTVTGAALAGAVGGTELAWIAFFTMNKIKIGVVLALLLTALVPALIELRANQALSAELKKLQASGAEVQTDNVRLMATLKQVGEKGAVPNEADDLAKMRARAALLRARPDGVVESQMRPPGNAGRATPEAAFETMSWALVTGDWKLFAETWMLTGESKALAEKYFSGLSPEAQQRFGTPEWALAYGWMAVTSPKGPEWMSAMQVYQTEIVDGPGAVRVRLWQRLGSGREFTNEAIFERGPDGGWLAAQAGVDRIVRRLIASELDPVTGELRPKQK